MRYPPSPHSPYSARFGGAAELTPCLIPCLYVCFHSYKFRPQAENPYLRLHNDSDDEQDDEVTLSCHCTLKHLLFHLLIRSVPPNQSAVHYCQCSSPLTHVPSSFTLCCRAGRLRCCGGGLGGHGNDQTGGKGGGIRPPAGHARIQSHSGAC